MNATWDSVSELGVAERGTLYALLACHFDGVTPAQFAMDLDEKTHVVRLWQEERLVGFSTFAYRRIAIAGIDTGATWSGDTIVDPQAWGAAQLPVAWLAAVLACHAERGPLAWCLICSGVRTWRLLPVFYRRYVPGSGDAELVMVRDYLARLRYGSHFNATTGIVRLPSPQVLRPHLRQLPVHLDTNEEAAGFIARNPGHQDGDELACATWITLSNLTPTGERIWRLAQRLREERL